MKKRMLFVCIVCVIFFVCAWKADAISEKQIHDILYSFGESKRDVIKKFGEPLKVVDGLHTTARSPLFMYYKDLSLDMEEDYDEDGKIEDVLVVGFSCKSSKYPVKYAKVGDSVKKLEQLGKAREMTSKKARFVYNYYVIDYSIKNGIITEIHLTNTYAP